MWPFFRKKTAEPPSRRVLAFNELVAQIGDLNDLQQRTTPLKFWLPQPAYEAIKTICDVDSISISEFMREVLCNHCYGIYAMIQHKASNDYLITDNRIRFAFVPHEWETPVGRQRATAYYVPDLGKNIVPIKVWIALRLQEDLSALAEHTGISLSQYVRETVIARTLGHGMLPRRPAMLEIEAITAGEAWAASQKDCELPLRAEPLDQKLTAEQLQQSTGYPWREVDYETYRLEPEGYFRDYWALSTETETSADALETASAPITGKPHRLIG